jgi:hypothetical protein
MTQIYIATANELSYSCYKIESVNSKYHMLYSSIDVTFTAL